MTKSCTMKSNMSGKQYERKETPPYFNAPLLCRHRANKCQHPPTILNPQKKGTEKSVPFNFILFLKSTQKRLI